MTININKNELKTIHIISLVLSLLGAILGYIISINNNSNIYIGIIIGMIAGYFIVALFISKLGMYRGGVNIEK